MIRSIFAVFALGAAAVLSSCASSRSLDKGISDIGANAELKAVLFSDRTHDYSDVDLTVYEGRLMLTGTMRSEEGRRKLIENAWKADGVSQVIDETFVGDKTPFGQGFEDSRIDAALRARLITSDEVKSGRIKIAVSNSTVYLLGSAPDQAGLDRTLELARITNNVEQVVTHLVVRAPGEPN